MQTSCPYTLLAHYSELEWVSVVLLRLRVTTIKTDIVQARSFGIDSDLVRISIGLEDVPDLSVRVQHALEAVEKARAS